MEDVDEGEVKEFKLPELQPIPRAWPAFHSWLRKHKLVLLKGTKPYSHTATCARLSGPIGASTADELKSMQEEYARAILRGEKLFLSEEAIAEHILFFDLDLHLDPRGDWPDSCHIERVLELGRDLHEALRFSCLPELGGVVIQSNPPIYAQKYGDIVLKFGIHIFWPDDGITVADHLRARSVLLQHCREEFGDSLFLCKLLNSWNDIIDGAVVRDPHLRMPFSRKVEFCKCKKDKVECKHYGQRGDADRRYDVNFALAANSAIDQKEQARLQTNVLYQVQRLSLRRQVALTRTDFPVNVDQLVEADRQAEVWLAICFHAFSSRSVRVWAAREQAMARMQAATARPRTRARW